CRPGPAECGGQRASTCGTGKNRRVACDLLREASVPEAMPSSVALFHQMRREAQAFLEAQPLAAASPGSDALRQQQQADDQQAPCIAVAVVEGAKRGRPAQ